MQHILHHGFGCTKLQTGEKWIPLNPMLSVMLMATFNILCITLC